MAWRGMACGFALGGLLMAGCAQTSRVSDNVTTASLAKGNKAVAIMRIGAASPRCLHVAVLLGVRDGDGFRGRQAITVTNVRSLDQPAVAEVELDPGEYHVVAYKCQTARGVAVVSNSADPNTYRTSYASFALQSGEIVNVGHLHFGAYRVGRSAFGRPVRVDVEVTDWPLADLERFKATRPQLYARMTTRLMTVNNSPAEPTQHDCSKLHALQAEGKRQTLPVQCQRSAAAPRM